MSLHLVGSLSKIDLCIMIDSIGLIWIIDVTRTLHDIESIVSIFCLYFCFAYWHKVLWCAVRIYDGIIYNETKKLSTKNFILKFASVFVPPFSLSFKMTFVWTSSLPYEVATNMSEKTKNEIKIKEEYGPSVEIPYGISSQLVCFQKTKLWKQPQRPIRRYINDLITKKNVNDA